MMSMAVNAEVIEYEDDNFYYDLDTEAKTAELARYKGSATEVSIPESVTYNGVAYTVTRLGNYCFYGCSFTSFTIPSTVKSLGEGCFNGCSSLKTLTCEIPVAIEGTFFNARDIEQTTLYVPESSVDSYQTTYQWNSFGTIKAIGGQYADYTDADGFTFCLNTKTKTAELTKYTGSATEVVIPTSVTYEGTEYSVTRLGTNSFNKCTSLTSVTIPSSVTSLGEGCFSWCYDLASISVDVNNPVYDSREKLHHCEMNVEVIADECHDEC